MSTDNTPQPSSSENENWTEQQLPPVKPPTAGFLMQLFFVPMIIVSIIVAVWLLFGWLAQSGTNPKQLSENLRQLNKGSWQDAHSLSNLLLDPREKELRQDSELAASLAETLVLLLEDPNLAVSAERHKLAVYLCLALGEFEVADGLQALIAAVKTDDFRLRRAGVEGIARLASNMKDGLGESQSELVEVLRGPAMERAPSAERADVLQYGEVRGRVAFSLGIIGGSEALDILAMMLSDPYPEARYNAATGLARHGDERAIDRLCEMLQVDNPEAVKYEVEEADTLRQWKTNKVIVNGVRAVALLYQVNASAQPTDEVRKAVEEVVKAGILQGNDALALDELVKLLAQRG